MSDYRDRGRYDDRGGRYDDRRYDDRMDRDRRRNSDYPPRRGGPGGRRDYEDRGRRRRRSRSRSRSPGPAGFVRRRLDISSSRERSRDRERRRRKLQAECIRRAGGFKKLADSEGREPVRLFWDGFQWVAKTGASSALLSDPILVNSTRKLRRLYFGNLPLHLGLTESNFQHIVYQEMKNRGHCNNPDENPVLCVWFAKDKGNYGFVEFASVEETERALTMDGMDCMGVAIKVSRPNDYSSATSNINPALAMMTQGGAVGTLTVGQVATQLTGAPGIAIPGGMSGASSLQPDVTQAELAISRVVCLKEIVLPNEVQEDVEYDEILEDVRSGCEGTAGRVMNSLIITPTLAKRDPVLDVGDVYLEFETQAGANKCMEGMQTRKYNGRPIRPLKISHTHYEDRVAKYAVPTVLEDDDEETVTSAATNTGAHATTPAQPPLPT